MIEMTYMRNGLLVCDAGDAARELGEGREGDVMKLAVGGKR